MKPFVVKYKDKIVMFCCVVASVAPLFLLVHLWFTPNVEIKERNIARNCILVEDYEMKELSRENTPLGIVKEYGFTISDELQHGTHLGFYISHHYAEVYIGEELVYSVMPSGRLKFIETIGCDWVLVPLLASDQGNRIRVILTPIYKSFMDWQPEFILGSSLDIYMKQLAQDAFCIICGLLSIAIGIVFSLQRGWRALKKKRDGYQSELGFFSVLLSLWVLTNTKSAPLLLQWHIIMCIADRSASGPAFYEEISAAPDFRFHRPLQCIGFVGLCGSGNPSGCGYFGSS